MWQLKAFNELSVQELFDIYQARVAVFVVEQNCAYQEVDNKDLQALHLFTKKSQKVTAYCRIIPETDGIHIGRVLVTKEARGSGLARTLMEQALQICHQKWQNEKVYVQAQAYLQDFYQSFGFKPVSAVYLEDGIPHLDMVRE